MKNWKPWIVGFLSAVIAIGAWFLILEIPAILDDVPGNTLSAEFLESACIGTDVCTNENAPVVFWGTLTLILGILSLAAWLLYHFYVEPVLYKRKHGKSIPRG
jgi:hypothetical protein